MEILRIIFYPMYPAYPVLTSVWIKEGDTEHFLSFYQTGDPLSVSAVIDNDNKVKMNMNAI